MDHNRLDVSTKENAVLPAKTSILKRLRAGAGDFFEILFGFRGRSGVRVAFLYQFG
jgi:hypothetical protein